MMKQRNLYVVFSSTPCKMGSFIRAMTRNRFNHVAIGTDPELGVLYSFARRYRDTPFYGGFVKESGTRYQNRGRLADIKVYALPVTEEQYRQAKARLDEMYISADKYLYNLLSAVFLPLKIRIRLPDAYTCVDFAVDFLSTCGICPELDPMQIYSIRRLEDSLHGKVVYEGPFPTLCESVQPDVFDEKQGVIRAAKLTVCSNAALIGRAFQRR